MVGGLVWQSRVVGGGGGGVGGWGGCEWGGRRGVNGFLGGSREPGLLGKDGNMAKW